jgi:hypothetical protein
VRAFIRRAARYIDRRLSPKTAAIGQDIVTAVAETTPVNPRQATFGKRRLNLLVPSINARHYFGGIHTAMQVFTEMAKSFDACRIVVTDSTPEADALARFSEYTAVEAAEDSGAIKQVVGFADRYGKTLPVSHEDHWVATAWWTAHAAQRLAEWQGRTFGKEGRLAYMIQDFEPGFYPWSSQSAMALATYRPEHDVGIFNTSLLADYFKAQGLAYRQGVVFEPTLNSGLRESLFLARNNIDVPRERRLVVYARPGTPRNAFTLICEALRVWGWSDPAAKEWDVVAPGELTEDIDLGPVRLRALGKLSIDAYAELLSTSAVGLSLMVSPHPSYPPLEMAAFGMGVVTNAYSNKNLSTFSENIRSVSVMSPEAIAEALKTMCAASMQRSMRPGPIMATNSDFLRDGSFREVASEAVRYMLP